MKLGVLGAGSIGCYVGGRLAHAGHDVLLVGRPGLAEELATHGLTLTDHGGSRWRVDTPAFATSPDALADRDAVLVAVKGLDTPEAAAALARVLPTGRLVMSLQNGVGNADVLRDVLPDHTVVPCMVPFNVLRMGDGRFHQGTSGHLVAADGLASPVVDAFASAALDLELHPDMPGVLWGKLLINLNNALNALSGLPLAVQLRDRRWRRVMAAQITEGLAALRAAGIRPVPFLPVPPRVVPWILRLPTPVFVRVARQMVAIDPEARSSMWEDLQRGRRTEVDLLNGAVVALGAAHGVETPVNAAVCAAIHAAEAGEDVAPRVDALLRRPGRADPPA